MKLIFLICLILFGLASARAQDSSEVITFIPPEIQEAITQGLEYLRAHQNIEGNLNGLCSDMGAYCRSGKKYGECCYGAWRSDIGYKLNQEYRPEKNEYAHIGVSALACLAFLAHGDTPERGEYAESLQAGLQYILNHTMFIDRRKDGSEMAFINHNGSRMYSHAFATLFLAEVYGMTQDERVREKLNQAVSLIEDCQNPKGAWRYQPYAQDADMSITVCQVQALRAARNVGIRVSKETIDKAFNYIMRVSDGHVSGDSYGRPSFKYQDIQYSRTSFALTAAGCTALHGVGNYDSKKIRPYLDELWRMKEPQEDKYSKSYFYYYGHYYAAQAFFIEGGTYWERWYAHVCKEFLKRSKIKVVKKRGKNVETRHWPSRFVGDIYSTAMVLVILQLPYKYLPILER